MRPKTECLWLLFPSETIVKQAQASSAGAPITEDGKMPKMKTNRGAAKRFKITGTGKVLRNKAFKSHILTKKSTKRKRNLRRSTVVASNNRKQIGRLIYHH